MEKFAEHIRFFIDCFICWTGNFVLNKNKIERKCIFSRMEKFAEHIRFFIDCFICWTGNFVLNKNKIK